MAREKVTEYFHRAYQRMIDEIEGADLPPEVVPAYLCWALVRVSQELNTLESDFEKTCENLKREYKLDYL